MGAQRVLIADDNRFIRTLVKAALAPDDYDIVEAVDGVDAFEKIGSEAPDLVLLDLVMPGMSGFEVLERMGAGGSGPPCPVMMLTTAASAADLERASAIGAADYLVKPFDKNELREKVAALLAE